MSFPIASCSSWRRRSLRSTLIPSNGASPNKTRCRSRMSAYSIGKMSDEPRHSLIVSVRGAVGGPQLRNEFIESHSRHCHQDPLEPPPPNPPPPPKPPNPPPPPPPPKPPPNPPPPQPPPRPPPHPPNIGMKIGKHPRRRP